MLRVTAAPEVAKLVLGARCSVLGWGVGSIEETILALAGNGAVFTRYDALDQNANAVWTAPGSKGKPKSPKWETSATPASASARRSASPTCGC